jgi:hypothetical protein
VYVKLQLLETVEELELKEKQLKQEQEKVQKHDR